MEFGWSDAQQDIYDRIRERAALWPDKLSPDLTRTDWGHCADLGIPGFSVPREYGGGGHGALETARAAEAFGAGCPDAGLVFSVLAHLLAVAMPISEHGGDEVRRRVLPLLSGGAWIGANAITEHDAGSDVSALATTARHEDGGYVLDGTKSWVSNGPMADVFLVYASTDRSLGHMGISAFVVERGTPGLEIGPPLAKASLTTCPAGPVTLHGCHVPESHRLGAAGQGMAIFQSSMRWERTCLLASYLGRTERLLRRCVTHARERRQFGRAIGDNQAVSHTVARLWARREAAGLLLWRACWRLDRGEAAVSDVAAAKLSVSELAVDVALFAVHVLGAGGVLDGTGAVTDLLDALPSTTFSGTSEMQLEQIAKELGL